jgi:cell division protein FtsW
MITFFASWMEKHQKLAPFLFLSGLPALLLMLQPDMGSTLIVLSIGVGIYFLAGAKMDFLLKLLVGGFIVLSIAVAISPYRLKRVTTFLNPEADPLGASFHIHQITLALGNGGILGRGLGQSRQKFSYIPEASTDSIFAIVAEEVGFVGSVFLLGLFAAYLWLAFRIWRRLPKKSFAYLLAGGLIIWIGMQICLNLGAIVALVPLTGIPLPFFSYGGTALVMVLFGTGILLGIGRTQTQP